jgi:hypothetical protein
LWIISSTLTQHRLPNLHKTLVRRFPLSYNSRFPCESATPAPTSDSGSDPLRVVRDWFQVRVVLVMLWLYCDAEVCF